MVLTGAPGAGKSAVLEALSGLLEEAGVAHGALESEQLAWGAPWLAPEVVVGLLAAVCHLQRAAGRRLFLISATTETEAELSGVVEAIGADQTLVVCLAAEPDTVAARIADREPDWWSGTAWLAGHARELAGVIPSLPGIDLVVSTEGETARDVARRVRDAMAARDLLA